jgi:hypothetical protein
MTTVYKILTEATGLPEALHERVARRLDAVRWPTR